MLFKTLIISDMYIPLESLKIPLSWYFNSRSWTETIHSGNRKIKKLLKCPIFNAKHHDMIEICISQLIAEKKGIL